MPTMERSGEPINLKAGMIRTTLLEVVNAVSEAAETDREVVAVIHHLLSSGRMRLVGEFTERDFAAVLS
jgi:hypothetical protein